MSEKAIETQLKNESKDCQLPLAPLKRLLLKGSEIPMHPGTETALTEAGALGTDHKVSGAALLKFRKEVENFALNLASKSGQFTRKDVRNTIHCRDIQRAVQQIFPDEDEE